jgi:hypothetical protein
MTFQSIRRSAVLSVVALGLVASSGCFGSFNLTRKTYAYNKSVSPDKWVQEVVFLAFMVIPVYSVVGAVDVLILNSIEFWTGENPVMASNTITREDGGRVVQSTKVTDTERSMTFDEYIGDELVSSTTVRHVNGADEVTVVVRYADGRSESRTVSRLDDGSVLVEQY